MYLGCTQREAKVDLRAVQAKTALVKKLTTTKEADEKDQTKENIHWDYETTGELSAVCAQIVLKCPYLARVGRPELLWSVRTLARSVTTLNTFCDKRLLRFINDINQTKNYTQVCHVENQIEDWKLGLFQDASVAGDLRDSKATSGGLLSVFGSHTCVPMSWMCKKQNAVYHSSAEFDILSLDAVYVWMDYHRFNLGNVSCRHYPVSQPRETLSVTQAKESSRLTHILTIVFLSQLTTYLGTFPTVHTQPNSTYWQTMRQWSKWSTKDEAQNLRHVTRSHRVDLDFLREWIWIILCW